MNDGGPAFPTTPVSHGYSPMVAGDGTGASPGMSLRDWYAGMALPAAIEQVTYLVREVPVLAEATRTDEGRKVALSRVAAMAYEVADAMLEARVMK